MKYAVRGLLVFLSLAVLCFFLLCFSVKAGENFAVDARYCKEHAAFTLTVTLPEDALPQKELFSQLEAIFPPFLSEPPLLLFELFSALAEEARTAVGRELEGCVAFPSS